MKQTLLKSFTTLVVHFPKVIDLLLSVVLDNSVYYNVEVRMFGTQCQLF